MAMIGALKYAIIKSVHLITALKKATAYIYTSLDFLPSAKQRGNSFGGSIYACLSVCM